MYGYDDMGQLISADHSETRPGSPIPDESFHYDDTGNRVSPSNPGYYSYDAANRLLKQGICSFTYDAAGNATSKACVGHMATDKKWEYAWDAWNRLSVVKYYEGINATRHKFTIAFGYDAFGRKVWRKKTVVGAQKPETEIYFQDGSDAMYTVKDNVVMERFLMGAGIDEPLAVYRTDGAYYFHADTLGSVAAITDEDGATRNLYAYESFGKHTRLCPSNTCIPNDSTYTAREWDDDLQLYNYRFRWQDPDTGKFNQEDPINSYRNNYFYVNNNPINYADPFGLEKKGTGQMGIAASGGNSGGGGTVAFGVIVDRNGGSGVFYTYGAGAQKSTTPTASVGIQLTVTNAKNSTDIGGLVTEAGGSGTFGALGGANVTVEFVAGSGYEGVAGTVGTGFGPAEGHVYVTETRVITTKTIKEKAVSYFTVMYSNFCSEVGMPK